MNRGRFRTKLEGHNKRRHVWICRSCHRWYSEGKQKSTRPVCDGKGATFEAGAILDAGDGCGSREFDSFSSEGEARRWMQLLMLQDAQRIADLVRQPTFELLVHDRGGAARRLCAFRPDFQYRQQDGELVVEDHKPRQYDAAVEQLWKLKAKHFELQTGIPVIITTA